MKQKMLEVKFDIIKLSTTYNFMISYFLVYGK